MRKRWIIWGTGLIGCALYDFLNEKCYIDNVIAVVDKEENKWGTNWNGITIQSPDILIDKNFDKLIIAISFWEPIYNLAVNEYKIRPEKVENYKFLQKKALLSFYEYNRKWEKKLKKELEYVKEHPLDTFNNEFVNKYLNVDIEVIWDRDKEMYYVMHLNKKMYFPKAYTKEKIKKYYRQILIEQDKESPHRYQSDTFAIEKDEIVLDVGVAEGNFSLEIIDKVKRLYLVEADMTWIEALNNTFEPYKDKVRIISKYMSDGLENECITIDELVKEEKFTSIKMDIEGMEIAALNGGRDFFSKDNAVKLFVCSYHRENDYVNIRKMLEKWNYTVDTTEGYMVFLPYTELKNIELPKFVKGVVRAYK